MPVEPNKSFFDYFVRPEQLVSTVGYSNRLSASVGSTEENEAKKYQSLFSDAFGHHVQFNLDTPPDISIQLDDSRRFVSADSLTSYFLDKLYVPPQIYETPNTRFLEEDRITFDQFVRSISDTPVTRNNGYGDAYGSNKISYIVGDVGSGKTLLLCKVAREIMRLQRDKFANEEKKLLIPVYFDFETEMKSDNGRLLDIDDKFYGKLCDSILKYLEYFSIFRLRTSGIAEIAKKDNFANEITRLISVIRHLHEQELRLLLILDNIDGYHYHYSKYSFFPEYHKQQSLSIQKNIMGLSSAISQGEHLGLMGLSVVLAARRYVYEDCRHSTAPEASCEYSGSVFQLEDILEDKIVLTRLKLFESAIEKMETVSKLRRFGEDYKKTLDRLNLLFGIKVVVSEKGSFDESKPVIKTIRKLCHHGNRDLVAFLSNLKFDYREEAELIERMFWDKPHTLVLLYLANLRERYSQKEGHFPNLFLVDAIVLRDPDFPIAHQPHQHTYWLKYLLLAFVVAQPDGIAHFSQLKRIFVDIGKYDDSLFRLTLGSLCTTKESRCLEPEPAERTIPAKVATTSRGKFLASVLKEIGTKFCFSFTYLQLIVDDYLMSYPESIWKEIYTKNHDLSYLFANKSIYGSQNRDYLLTKMNNVLSFIHVLEISYNIELNRRKELFESLKQRSPSVLVDFDKTVNAIFSQYYRILHPWGETLAQKELSKIKTHWEDLKSNRKIKQQINDYFESGLMVEE